MVWGLMRIVLFTIAFVVGMMVIGPFKMSAGSKSFNPPRLDEHIGTSLVVACENGNVVVKHVEGAVQLECARHASGRDVQIEDAPLVCAAVIKMAAVG